MEKALIHFIILGVVSGLTKGAGVLPDGPLKAAVGGRVMFTTTLTPTVKLFSVSWELNDKPITISAAVNNTAPEFEGRLTLFIYTGSLELRNVALNESGEYSVFITHAAGNTEEGNIRLNVYEPVSTVTATANTTDLVEFISSVRLSCSSSGSPPFSFLWLNGSSEVTESDRVQLTDGNSTLTILNVARYDQGPFRCRVSSPVSNDTSDPINLFISYNPTTSGCSGGCIAGAVIASLVVVGAAVGGAYHIYMRKFGPKNMTQSTNRITSNTPPPTGKEPEENEYENISTIYENI